MEVDSSDVNSESSRGMDDPEEAITPEDMDAPFMDGEKDEETVKTIRCLWLLSIYSSFLIRFGHLFSQLSI